MALFILAVIAFIVIDILIRLILKRMQQKKVLKENFEEIEIE